MGFETDAPGVADNVFPLGAGPGGCDVVRRESDIPLAARASNSSLLRSVSALIAHAIACVPFPGKDGHEVDINNKFAILLTTLTMM